MSHLYIVATPIGNLQDITLRALDVLKSVDFVIAEDTRQTRKLLSHFDIAKPIVSLHAKSSLAHQQKIIDRLQSESGALVTDAGTPGIADPGGVLVSKLDDQVQVVPIPGPSAVVTLLSVAGMKANQFVFMGYAPHKKGRSKFFDEILQSPYTVVFFETPHRIAKTLESLKIVGSRRVVVGRELTKQFEMLYRATGETMIDVIPEADFRGEFVIAIES